MPTPNERYAHLHALTALAITLNACAPNNTATPEDDALAGVAESERLAQRRIDQQRDRDTTNTPAADNAAEVLPVDASIGFTIPSQQLTDRLREAAGAEILAELVLERLLEQRAADRGIDISDADLNRERRLIANAFQQVNDPTTADNAASERLLDAVRARRGLGPVRFQALVRRQAIMRALVAPDVNVGEPQIRLAYELRYGPRARVRIITTDRLAQAQDAADRIRAGQPPAAVAADTSTDPSAAQGGSIDPISPADPAYPAAIREAVIELLENAQRNDLTPGDANRLTTRQRLSPAVRLQNGFALLYLEEVIPPENVPIASVADELALLMRRRQERLLMEQLARDLLRNANVTPQPESLRWAWQTRDRRR